MGLGFVGSGFAVGVVEDLGEVVEVFGGGERKVFIPTLHRAFRVEVAPGIGKWSEALAQIRHKSS